MPGPVNFFKSVFSRRNQDAARCERFGTQEQTSTPTKADRTQMVVKSAKERWSESIGEVIKMIKIVSCNHKDDRYNEFSKIKAKMNIYLRNKESQPDCDPAILNLKDKKIDFAYIPYSTHFNEEYERLTQIRTLIRDPQLLKEERAIKDKNSLFHNRPDLKDHRLELLEIASDLNKAVAKNQDDFKESTIGASKPIFYRKRKVIFKRIKNVNIEIYSHIIRKKLDELGLDKLILPTREVWRERRVQNPDDPTNNVPVVSAVYIEDDESLGVLEYPQARFFYSDSPDIFNEIVRQITTLNCYYEIGDLCLSDKKMEGYKYMYRNKFIPGAKQDDCRCNFDNLLFKTVVEGTKGDSYRFVLADIDFLLSPSKSTVTNLLRSFPSHKKLIMDTVKKHNPNLLKNRSKEIRQDIFSKPTCHYKDSTVVLYGREERFKKDYGLSLRKIEEEKLAAEGKLDGYNELVKNLSYKATDLES